MKQIWAKHKGQIMVGVVIILILLAVFMGGKNSVKANSFFSKLFFSEGESVNIRANFDPYKVANKLYNNLDGYASKGDFRAAMDTIMQLSDEELLLADQAFSELYYKKDPDERTLHDYVSRETTYLPRSKELKSAVEDRLDRLGI